MRFLGPSWAIWPARAAALAACAALVFLVGAGPAPTSPSGAASEEAAAWRARLARPPLDRGRDEMARKQAVLGLALFRDRRLSGDQSFACETCHYHGLSFTDARRRAVGILAEELERNTPPLWNLAFAARLRWDGRIERLDEQVAIPVVSPREMGGHWPTIVARLNADEPMRRAFAEAFPGEQIGRDTIATALAAYVRTLVSPPTRFDRFAAGDDGALDAAERRGFELFVGKAGCVACHRAWRFTDDAPHATGSPADPVFRTPPLRELLWSAPYLHDGSAPSLDEALSRHAAGLAQAGRTGAAALSSTEREALIAFLATLSSEAAPRPVTRP